MKLKLISLVVMLLFVSCDESQQSADARVRGYFQLPEFGEITSESLRSALLRKIPLGTSASEISTILEQGGIGKDQASRYYPLDENGEIVCRANHETDKWDFNSEEFVVVLLVGGDKRLKTIEVRKAITGM